MVPVGVQLWKGMGLSTWPCLSKKKKQRTVRGPSKGLATRVPWGTQLETEVELQERGKAIKGPEEKVPTSRGLNAGAECH